MIDNAHNIIEFNNETHNLTLTRKGLFKKVKAVHEIPYGAITYYEDGGTSAGTHFYNLHFVCGPEPRGLGDPYALMVAPNEIEQFENEMNDVLDCTEHAVWVPEKRYTNKKEAQKDLEDGAVAKAEFHGLTLKGDTIRYQGLTLSTSETTATVTAGDNSKKISAGRVIGGAVLAGPAGAVIGAMAGKDKSQIIMLIESNDGRSATITVPKKEMEEAVRIANLINRL